MSSKRMRNVCYLIGQVVKQNVYRDNQVKVRCNRMKLDKHLLMYFPKRYDKWAVVNREEMDVNIGDIVLIEDTLKKVNPTTTFIVKEHVFKVGAVKDPLTGRIVRGTEFIDEESRAQEIEQRKAVDMVEGSAS